MTDYTVLPVAEPERSRSWLPAASAVAVLAIVAAVLFVAIGRGSGGASLVDAATLVHAASGKAANAGSSDVELTMTIRASGRTVTATVTLPSGQAVEGKLVRVDEYLITLTLADGSQRSFRRTGDTPKVVIHDPLKAHRDLLPQYSDRDIHDVTAYLVTLK